MAVRKLVFAGLFATLLAGQNVPPLRVAIIGLVHGHVAGFASGGALAPAGGIVNRPDVQVVAVVEPDDALFQKYSGRFHWPASMHFHSIAEMAAQVHPDAALVFTSTAGHTKAVEECAARGIHVMMEKPLAVSYNDALAMEAAAERGHIHVLVDYETTWYASNAVLHDSAEKDGVIKAVFRDGHNGPVAIHVQPEFMHWLLDPKENGAGALYDFGGYGADLMTWFLNGEQPGSVTAVTRHLQPSLYPRVDDEADIILTYKGGTAIVQASWDWPFGLKQADLYNKGGFAEANDSKHVNGDVSHAPALKPPYDDPIHYLAAVIRGEINEGNDPSSLKTNVTVSEILDAARKSAATGKTISLPLQ